jgi:hypothetical protein
MVESGCGAAYVLADSDRLYRYVALTGALGEGGRGGVYRGCLQQGVFNQQMVTA